MRLILHLGAHATDGGKVADWMSENRADFAEQGLCAPPPRAFLQALSAALLDQDTDPRLREETLLRSLGASGARRWMSVSAAGLLGAQTDVISSEGFYVKDMVRRLHALNALFPRSTVTVLLSVRTASGILPAMVAGNADALANRMASLNMATLPWAHVVRQIRRHMPRAQVVVWRHEDFATLWPRVLSVMSGPLDSVPSEGLLTFAANGLSAEGRVRLQRYCETNPQPTIGHLRRVVALFGTRYGKPPALPETGHLPAWVRAEFARLDQGYDTELDDIAGQSGVTVLHP